MLNTVWAVVQNGRLETIEEIAVPEGTRALVTLFADEESDFWTQASSSALDKVWDNAEDDRYAELLKD